jgi:hypothetical protein
MTSAARVGEPHQLTSPQLLREEVNASLTGCVGLSRLGADGEFEMVPHPHAFEEEQCPVSDQTLGELYRSSSEGLDALIATVPSETRAGLAMYCYRRAHLASVGLAVAARCDETDLANWGGYAGKVLFLKSREAPQPPHITAPFGRRKITLATGSLRTVCLTDDEIDEEDL